MRQDDLISLHSDQVYRFKVRIALVAAAMESAACLAIEYGSGSDFIILDWLFKGMGIGAIGAICLYLGIHGQKPPLRVALSYGITLLPMIWLLMLYIDPIADQYGPLGSGLSGSLAAGMSGGLITGVYNRVERHFRSPRRLVPKIASFLYHITISETRAVTRIGFSLTFAFMVFEGMFVLGQVLIPITVQNIWLVLAWGMLGFVSALTAIGVLKICDLVLGRPRHIATVTP